MVRIVQRRYEQSMVRTVQEGTNSPRYEQSKVRIVREPGKLSSKPENEKLADFFQWYQARMLKARR